MLFRSDLGITGGAEPMAQLRNQGQILGPDGQRMSKSRGSIQLTPMSQPDRPMRTKATLKRAEVAHTRTSAPSASANPPPAAGPCT